MSEQGWGVVVYVLNMDILYFKVSFSSQVMATSEKDHPASTVTSLTSDFSQLRLYQKERELLQQLMKSCLTLTAKETLLHTLRYPCA